MKQKMMLLMFAFLLTGVCAQAEETYIVKFNDSIQTYAENSAAGNFCTATYEEVQEYLDMGIVEYYEPDCEIFLLDDYISNTYDSIEWNLSAINIEKAWDIGCYGNETRVAVIDSGVYAHSDLKSNIVTGYNYIEESTDTTDNIGHGTCISGIIAAEYNGTYINGAAHHTKIVPLKCFEDGFKTSASLIANVIYDAVDVYDCDVINASFGVDGISNKTLQLAVEYAIQNGCIVVASVGNDNASTEYYPAKYDGVTGVGSVTGTLSRSSFSQYNSTVDVMAPGSSILSLSVTDGFVTGSGTSFAAPHVSAVAAIAKCIDKNISPEQFNELIKTTSTDLGTKGYDIYYGYGLIDAQKIVDSILENTSVFVSPVTGGTVKVYNNSGSLLKATGIAASYTDSKIFKAQFSDIELASGEIKDISLDSGGKLTKFLIWDSLKDLQPLYQPRIYK